jgi:phosphatidylglycerophosphate synthase
MESPKKHGWFYRNIPNMLTCSRFSAPFILFLSPWTIKTKLMAIAILSLTDLEGTLAKIMKVISRIGAVLDAFADLVMKVSLLIYVLSENFVDPPIVVILPLAGEVSIALLIAYGIRHAAKDLWKEIKKESFLKNLWHFGWAIKEKIIENIKVELPGKIKTACYYSAAAFVFANVLMPHKLLRIGYLVFFITGLGFFFLAFGMSYLKQAKNFFSGE